MATLTNTKIKDTYDGLLKTADNDVVGTSEKNITDGLGNATVLSIGTASASFSSDVEVNGLTIGKGTGDVTQNTAVGFSAVGGTGIGNTGVGYASLLANTSGGGNSALGINSLRYNTSGAWGVAVGYQALFNNTTGQGNTALGATALQDNTIGSNNVAVGYISLANNIDGQNNTAVGYNTLGANTSGGSNVAVGTYALENNNADYNVAVGLAALRDNTTGTKNVAVGLGALGDNTTGQENVAVGQNSGFKNTTGIWNTSLGASSLYHNTASSNTAIGAYSLNGNTSGTQNTAVGKDSLRENTTGGSNTAVGYNSLGLNTTGLYNSALGVSALGANLTGGSNVAIGYLSLRYNTTGSQNSALGKEALRDNTTGAKNTALGESALANNLTSDSNTAVGYRALYTSEGAYNTAIGSQALNNNTTGGFNSAMGYSSLTTNTTGSYNISIGVNSLLSNTDGDRNVALGYGAGDSKTSGDGNIYIGHSADGASATTSNEIVIGQNAVGKGSDTTFIGGDDVYLGSSNTLGNVIIERLGNTRLALEETAYSETFSLSSNYIGGKVIYRTDTLDHTFNIGSSEMMRIDSSGRVGIGNSSPDGVLNAKSGTSPNGAQIIIGYNNTSENYFDANTQIFRNGSFAEKMRIDSSGRVGIGTTSMTEKLEVNGAIVWEGALTTSQTSAGVLDRSGDDLRIRVYGATAGSGNFVVRTGGGGGSVDSEAMRIDSSGRVGIGTAPSYPLHILGSHTIYGAELSTSSTATTSYNVMRWTQGAGSGAPTGYIGTGGSAVGNTGFAGAFGIGTQTSAPVTFLTNDTERMRIDSSGFVGIGTSSPSEKLTIDSGYITIKDNAYDTYFLSKTRSDGSQLVGFQSHSLGALSIHANGGEKMRIDRDGNVGIGTQVASSFNQRVNAPHLVVGSGSNSAGVTIYSGTTAQGSINFADGTTTTEQYMGGIIYVHGTDNYMAFNTNGATERMRIDSSGNVIIAQSSSIGVANSIAHYTNNFMYVRGGTAGLALGDDAMATSVYMYDNSFMAFNTAGSEAMRIDSSGRVGIGKSSPDGLLNLKHTSSSGAVANDASAYAITLDFAGNTNDFGRHIAIRDAGGAAVASMGGIDYGVSGATGLYFATGDVNAITERMRITSGGAFKASTGGTYLNSGAVYHELRQETNSQHIAFLSNTGTSAPQGVQIRFTGAAPNNTSSRFLDCVDSTTNAKFILYSNGDVVNTNNSYGAISDAKLKENVTDASPKLDDLLQVKVRNFNYIGDDKKQLGVVAQELESVFPSMIDESPDFEEQEVIDEEGNVTKERVDLGTTTKSVKYSVFVPMLIKAMQEQQDIINDLKARIETLEAK